MENNEFGKAIQQLRIEYNLSQRQFVELFNVSNQAVSFWESGQREPDMDIVKKISAYFGVTIDYLYGKE